MEQVIWLRNKISINGVENRMIKLKIWLYNWLAKDLGKLGREGDTELAHVNTWEANLLKAHGGSGTINPVTGLREYKGGGGSQTQTTNQNIDPAILPYITYGLGEAQNLYKADSPEYYPSATYVPASATTTGEKAISGSEAVTSDVADTRAQLVLNNSSANNQKIDLVNTTGGLLASFGRSAKFFGSA